MNISPSFLQYGSLLPIQLSYASQRPQGSSLPNLFAQAQFELLHQYEHLRALQFNQISQQLNIQSSPLYLFQEPSYGHSYAPFQSLTSNYAQELTLKQEFLSEERDSTQSEKFSLLNLSPDSHLKNQSSKSFLAYQKTLADLNKAQQHFSTQEDWEANSRLLIKEESLVHETCSTKTKLFNMINYLVTRLGKENLDKLSHQRALYESDPRMLRVFDALVNRYSATGKCREDMSRYAMRKALTFLRDQERQISNTKTRDASLALCKKYFDQSLTNSHTDRELMNELLPYKKNSKNKTPNHNFTRKIFSSQAFCRDYQFYLSSFHEIMKVDNSKRIKTLVDFLVCCVEQDKLEKIDQYKRLPWLDVWTESMYIVATELPSRNFVQDSQHTPQKRVKRGKI